MGVFKLIKQYIHFIILVTYAFILFKYINEKDIYTMIGLTIVTGFSLLHSRKLLEGQTTTTTSTTTTDAERAQELQNQINKAKNLSPPAPKKQAKYEIIIGTATAEIGQIKEVKVIDGGSGYYIGATASIDKISGTTTPPGSGATITLEIDSKTTSVKKVKVTSAGSLYDNANKDTKYKVTETNGFPEAHATVQVGSNKKLVTGTLKFTTNSKTTKPMSGGGTYIKGTTILFEPVKGGSGATATVKVKDDGTLSDLKITNVGENYELPPIVRIINGDPVKAASDEAAKKIKSLLESKEYKDNNLKKQEILNRLSALQGVKASNFKEDLPIPPQKYLRKDTLIRVMGGVPRIGAYDGLCLSGLTNKTNYEIVSNDKVNSYLGVQYPTKDVSTEDDVLDGPAVDGDEDSPHKLSMFANNMTSINCCGDSPYVSSSGCLCMTKKQKQFIQNRGLYSTKETTSSDDKDKDDDDDDDEEIKVTKMPKPTKDEIILISSGDKKGKLNKKPDKHWIDEFDYRDVVVGKYKPYYE